MFGNYTFGLDAQILIDFLIFIIILIIIGIPILGLCIAGIVLHKRHKHNNENKKQA